MKWDKWGAVRGAVWEVGWGRLVCVWGGVVCGWGGVALNGWGGVVMAVVGAVWRRGRCGGEGSAEERGDGDGVASWRRGVMWWWCVVQGRRGGGWVGSEWR